MTWANYKYFALFILFFPCYGAFAYSVEASYKVTGVGGNCNGGLTVSMNLEALHQLGDTCITKSLIDATYSCETGNLLSFNGLFGKEANIGMILDPDDPDDKECEDFLETKDKILHEEIQQSLSLLNPRNMDPYSVGLDELTKQMPHYYDPSRTEDFTTHQVPGKGLGYVLFPISGGNGETSFLILYFGKWSKIHSLSELGSIPAYNGTLSCPSGVICLVDVVRKNPSRDSRILEATWLNNLSFRFMKFPNLLPIRIFQVKGKGLTSVQNIMLNTEQELLVRPENLK